MAHATTPGFEREFRLEGFLRGNTHTHSSRSDGDSAPERVVEWYRDHGYHFVVLTDHNEAMVPGEFDTLGIPGRFVAIAGEELSYWAYRGKDKLPVHVNSICATSTAGEEGKTIDAVLKALQYAINRVIAQPGAIAQVNHPNYTWALKGSDLSGVGGAALLEVANQHPHVNNGGANGKPSVEALWDTALTAGKRYFGTAADDMHDLWKTQAELGYTPRRPGLGWVQVAGKSVDPAAICEALSRGDFYSSSGVELAWIEVSAREYAFEIIPSTGEQAKDYRVTFIGASGKVLSQKRGDLAPSYALQGGERYVRARIDAPGRKKAWLQPVFVR